MIKLLQTPAFTLEHDIANRLLKLTRSAVVFDTAADVDAAYTELIAKAESIDRTQFVLLSDMRNGPKPPPPGSEVEAAFQRNTKRFRQGFRRIAILVKSPVGKLQATRVKQVVAEQAAVFHDEAEALGYLLAKD